VLIVQYLLSEVGFVYVTAYQWSRPVARGGYRDGVGGDKCGGLLKVVLGATTLVVAANDALVVEHT
jgi:hypothetical protein